VAIGMSTVTRCAGMIRRQLAAHRLEQQKRPVVRAKQNKHSRPSGVSSRSRCHPRDVERHTRNCPLEG
jgi:hypothetical protein